MLIELYQRENRLEDAFDLVEELGDFDPETYYEIYEELLEPFAAKKTGRGHYQTIVNHLEDEGTRLRRPVRGVRSAS